MNDQEESNRTWADADYGTELKEFPDRTNVASISPLAYSSPKKSLLEVKANNRHSSKSLQPIPGQNLGLPEPKNAFLAMLRAKKLSGQITTSSKQKASDLIQRKIDQTNQEFKSIDKPSNGVRSLRSVVYSSLDSTDCSPQSELDFSKSTSQDGHSE